MEKLEKILAITGISILALLLFGIPFYFSTFHESIIELSDCEICYISGNKEIISDVYDIRKIGILDQEYIFKTSIQWRRIRAAAVATYKCEKNGKTIIIKNDLESADR